MQPNVVLIVCDTLRKDVIQLYGGEAKTPNLNRFAKDAMTYENAIAPSPWTFPSHVSLFTGLYPSQHKVHETSTNKIPALIDLNRELKVERLAESLKNLGYTTIGLSNNLTASQFTKFDIGFDEFFSFEPSPWLRSQKAMAASRMGSNFHQIAKMLIKKGQINEIGDYAKEFMNVRKESKKSNYPFDKGAEFTNKVISGMRLPKKFFLFLNYYDVHDPYRGENIKEKWENFTGTSKVRRSTTQKLRREYLLETEYLDDKLGKLLSILKDKGEYDNSLIIITSDHGQAFNEHGCMYHNAYVYDELVRIPLLIKYPKARKFNSKKGYQSLTGIPSLVKDIIMGKDDMRLTTETAFSESYGNNMSPPEAYFGREEYVKEKYEKIRKAVYKGKYKMTVNGTEGAIEEFMVGGKETDPKLHRAAVKDLIRVLKRFNTDRNFTLPKI